MRYHEIKTEVGKAYFRFWNNGLRAIAGWSDAQIESWADQFKDRLNNDSGLFFHSHPGEFLVPVFLPLAIREAAAKKGCQPEVLREMADALNYNLFPELWDGHGWPEAKTRVEKTLRKLQEQYP